MAAEPGEKPSQFHHTLVDRTNFDTLYPVIVSLIESSAFVAIDCEFTGLGESRDVRSRNVEERYAAMSQVVQTHSLLALGLSIFCPKTHSISSETPYLEQSSTETKSTVYGVHNFTLLLSNIKPYTVSPSSLTFLVESGFDFHEQIRFGIQYVPGPLTPSSASAVADKTEHVSGAGKKGRGRNGQSGHSNSPRLPFVPESTWNLRSLYRLLFQSHTRLVTHNGLMDILFLYASFYNTPPPALSTFLADLADGMSLGKTSCLYDTKFVAEFMDREASTFLAWLYKKFQRCGQGGVYPTIQISVPVAGIAGDDAGREAKHKIKDYQLEKVLPRQGGGATPKYGGKPYCEHFAAHGFCKNGRQCPVSHDLDFIFDFMEGRVNAASSKRRKGEDGEVNELPPSMGNPKAIVVMTLEGKSQDSESVTDARNVSTLSSPASPNGKCHSAAYDAYMTGFLFAHYLSREASNTSLSMSSKGSAERLEIFAKNKLYLIGKDMPLLVMKSPYASCSLFHASQRCFG